MDGIRRTSKSDAAHRTLKYALIILPHPVLMPHCPSSRCIPPPPPSFLLVFDLRSNHPRTHRTARVYMQKRDKRMQFQYQRSQHPAIFLFSRNVRCQEPSAVPEIFPVCHRGVEGCGSVGWWWWWWYSRARWFMRMGRKRKESGGWGRGRTEAPENSNKLSFAVQYSFRPHNNPARCRHRGRVARKSLYRAENAGGLD